MRDIVENLRSIAKLHKQYIAEQPQRKLSNSANVGLLDLHGDLIYRIANRVGNENISALRLTCKRICAEYDLQVKRALAYPQDHLNFSYLDSNRFKSLSALSFCYEDHLKGKSHLEIEQFLNQIPSYPNLKCFSAVGEFILSSKFCENLSQLPNLSELDLRFCQYHEEDFHKLLSRLNQLKILDLCSPLVNLNLDYSASIANLIDLSLTYSDGYTPGSLIPKLLYSAGHLENLDFYFDGEFNGELLKFVQSTRLTSLKVEMIDFDELGENLGDLLMRSPNLSELKVSNQKDSLYIPGAIDVCDLDNFKTLKKPLPRLKALKLMTLNCKSRAAKSILRQATNLETLHLDSDALDQQVIHLLPFTALRALTLSGVHWSNDSLRKTLLNLKRIRSIHLTGLASDQNVISWLGNLDSSLNNLKILRLKNISMTDSATISILKSAVKLEEIALSSSQLTNRFLEFMPTKSLRNLQLNEVKCGDNSLRQFLANLKMIKKLDFSRINLSDTSLAILVDQLIRLSTLRLNHCPNITNRGIENLKGWLETEKIIGKHPRVWTKICN